MPGPSPSRVVVKVPNHLGDLVLSLPALSLIRQELEHCNLAVLVPRRLAPFYRATDWIDAVISHDWPVGLSPSRHRNVIRSLRHHEPDLLLLLIRGFEFAVDAVAAGVPRRVGESVGLRRLLLTHAVKGPRDRRRTHESDAFVEVARRSLSTSAAAVPCAPAVDASERARVCAWLARVRRHPERSLVALFPSSGANYKRWLCVGYNELLDRLQGSGQVECVVVSAPWERAVAEDVVGDSQHPTLISSDTDIAGLIALLSLCDAYVGNDAGPTHLAAALGVPTVALFFATDPRRWAPRGPRVRVLSAFEGSPGSMNRRHARLSALRISASDVERAIMKIGGIGVRSRVQEMP